MENQRGVNLCKAKLRSIYIPKIERQMYGCHEPYLRIFTHNLSLSASSWLLSRYALPLLRLRLFSTVQLGLLLWPRELDKPPWSSSLLFIIDLNTALLVQRSLTAAISFISSASVMLECWQNLSKLTNQRVYQIPDYRNDLFGKFAPDVLSLPLAALSLFFSRAVFCTAPWLTERLEEATLRGLNAMSFRIEARKCNHWASLNSLKNLTVPICTWNVDLIKSRMLLSELRH